MNTKKIILASIVIACLVFFTGCTQNTASGKAADVIQQETVTTPAPVQEEQNIQNVAPEPIIEPQKEYTAEIVLFPAENTLKVSNTAPSPQSVEFGKGKRYYIKIPTYEVDQGSIFNPEREYVGGIVVTSVKIKNIYLNVENIQFKREEKIMNIGDAAGFFNNEIWMLVGGVDAGGSTTSFWINVYYSTPQTINKGDEIKLQNNKVKIDDITPTEIKINCGGKAQTVNLNNVTEICSGYAHIQANKISEKP